jgi:predicted Zn finger-like uncharacterized protein
MPETIRCPQCGRELRVPDSLLGKKVKCPSCATTFSAPVPGAGTPGEGYEQVPEPPPGPVASAAGSPEAPPPAGGRPREIDWIANMALFGGIWACVLPLFCCLGNAIGQAMVEKGGFNFGLVCCFPFEIYSLVVGVLSIMTGMRLRRPDAHLQAPPTVNAILRIVNLIMFDWPNVAMGAYTLYLLRSNPAVQAYFQRGSAAPTAPPTA